MARPILLVVIAWAIAACAPDHPCPTGGVAQGSAYFRDNVGLFEGVGGYALDLGTLEASPLSACAGIDGYLFIEGTAPDMPWSIFDGFESVGAMRIASPDITRVEGFPSLTSIGVLELYGEIAAVDGLNTVTALDELVVGYIGRLGGLNGVTALEHLGFDGGPDELSGLTALETVTRLEIVSTRFPSLASLESLRVVEDSISIRGTRLEHLDLPAIERLGGLALWGNGALRSVDRVTTLTAIEGGLSVTSNNQLASADVLTWAGSIDIGGDVLVCENEGWPDEDACP